jgi:hypothetical protein
MLGEGIDGTSRIRGEITRPVSCIVQGTGKLISYIHSLEILIQLIV